ncbi:MAG: AI-2E family transporter [Bdellovibrionota bacterium]
MQTVNQRGSITPLQQKIIVGVLALFFVSFYFLRTIYIPIFIAYFLAFLLNPIVRWAEKRGFGRVGPIFLMLLIVFAVLISFTVVMVPRIVVQLHDLFLRLPQLMDFLSARIGPYSMRYLGYDVFTQWKEVLPTLIPEGTAIPAMGVIIENFLAGTAKAISALLTVLMIPILTFYMLKDYYVLNRQLLQMVPRRYVADVQEVMRRLSIVLGGLIRGQFLICAILAAYYSLTLSSVVDMALLLGIISGFLNLIPFVGMLTSLGLSLFIAILGGAHLTQCIAILGIYLIANLVDNTILTPRIVGKQMGISPLTIILALLAGGELLGFLGILLALPIMAMVKVLGGYLTERYFESSYYKEEPPVADKQVLSDTL